MSLSRSLSERRSCSLVDFAFDRSNLGEASRFSTPSIGLYMEIVVAEASAGQRPEEIQMESGFSDSPPLDATTRNPLNDLEEPVPGQKNCFIASEEEEEKIQENDLELNCSSPKDVLKNYTLNQGFKDDCFIPSPLLKSISKLSFFCPDLVSALQKMGENHNSLLIKRQDKNFEAEVLQGKYKAMLNKCMLECQPRYEKLEKEHSECQNLISEIEMLRANCEALSNKCLQECNPKYETLKGILAEETSERKRLHNELIELRGNIRIFCRCRPLSAEEISKGYNSVIEFDPFKDAELQITCADSSKKCFKFEHVFSPCDEQEVVFSETIPVVKSVMDGYNACIFAYGQTGTGKTFTMEGTPESRGVNYRALEELFRITTQRTALMRYEFSFSMLEVYNEKIRDLLADSSDLYVKKLDIKQSAEGTQEVPGLTEVRVCTIDEVWEMLQSGGKNRSVGATNANEASSRSHSLVRVTIKGENLVNGERSRSFLWLVDLAGSERVGKIEAEGERLKESQYINKSLSALGDVISALASKNSHIPYRNSKLTHLLQSSLGGDCKTLMFAQISPSPGDLGETLCTLNFASRVRGVEHGPAKKQSDPADNFKLKQMAEKLRLEEKETSRLNESLQMMHIRYASRENVFRTLQEKIRESDQACKQYQQKIKELENQIAEGRNAARSQIPSSKASFRPSPRPPLAPTAKQRPPLARITNRPPPPFAPPPHLLKRANSIPANKENNEYHHAIKEITGIPRKPLGKARRISLSPVLCNMAQTKRRRATLAAEIETALPQFPEKRNNANSTSFRSNFSQLGIPRRISFAPLVQETPPMAKGNCFKYSTPSHMQQAMWKPRVVVPSSPLHPNRIFSSGERNNSSVLQLPQDNRLCYSVHRNLIVDALKGKDIVVGRFGAAQRVLNNKNRRKTLL